MILTFLIFLNDFTQSLQQGYHLIYDGINPVKVFKIINEKI